MRAHEGYGANFATTSTSSPVDTMVMGYQPLNVPLLPLIVDEKDGEHHENIRNLNYHKYDLLLYMVKYVYVQI